MAVESKHKFSSFIITDFETGGKDPSEVAITEIAMIGIRSDTLEEIGRYQALIAPYPQIICAKTKKSYRYEEEAAKITGIDSNLLETEGKDIKVVSKEMIEFYNLCNIHKSKTGWKPIIVAHNAMYELRCLQHMYVVTDMQKQYAAALHGDFDFFGNFLPHYIDTIDVAKELWAHNQRMTSFALGPVAERAGIEQADAHRAMNDVIPTTQFLTDTIKAMRSSGGAINSEGGKSYRDNFKFFQF